MTTVRQLHQQAMDIAHESFVARQSGNILKAEDLITQAFGLEREAAQKVPDGENSEPTRSILYRSAASLAFQANQFDESIRLIGMGLSGYPPPKIGDDLLRLLDQVKFKKYLEETSKEVDSNGILLTLRGKAVEVGMVFYEEFQRRYDNTSKLIDRTTQRLTNKPYTRGVDKQGFTFKKLIEVPSAQHSFAITMKLSTPQAPSLFIPKPSDVIDEVVYGIGLVDQGRESELKQHIQDDAYFVNFVSLARQIAPDGEDVDHVGFVSATRNASMSRTRNNILQMPPPNQDADNEQKYEPFDNMGRLGAADDIRGQYVVIELNNGKTYKIKLTEGIDDIVVSYWNKQVHVTGIYDGDYIYASDIVAVKD